MMTPLIRETLQEIVDHGDRESAYQADAMLTLANAFDIHRAQEEEAHAALIGDRYTVTRAARLRSRGRVPARRQ